jgi:hypothetical protein
MRNGNEDTGDDCDASVKEEAPSEPVVKEQESA